MPEGSLSIGQVLIVDTDDVARGLLARLLQSVQYDCVAVSSGQDALSSLQRRAFDVMLCDTGLEDMASARLVEQVKKQAPTTEVILMARSLKAQAFGEAIRTGAFDFLQKPLQAGEVLVRVREARDLSRVLVLSSKARRRLTQALDRVVARRERATRMAEQVNHREEPLPLPSGLARPFPKTLGQLRRRRLNHLRRARTVGERIRQRAEKLTQLARWHAGAVPAVGGAGSESTPKPEVGAVEMETSDEVRG